MQLKYPVMAIVFLSSFLLSLSLSWSSQVVTEESRLWARHTLEREGAFQALDGKNTLAVLYFYNKTGKAALDPLQKGLTFMLITDLAALEDIQLVERVRLQALVEELQLGTAGLVEPATAPRVGSLLGAEWLVGGDILGDGQSSLRIESRLLDVPASLIVGEPGTAGSLSELFRMEKDLLFGIIDLLKIELSPEQRAVLEKPCSTSEDALMELFRGIDASDRGSYQIAAEFYEKALQKDPGICEAQEAVQQLRSLGLISMGNRSSELMRSLRKRVSLTDQFPDESSVSRVRTPDNVTTPLNIDINFPE